MAATIGGGSVTFSTLTALFKSDGGVAIDGKKIPAVPCTVDTDTNIVYKAGNLPDFGQLKGNIFVLATSLTEMDTLVGTTATLLWTSDLEVSTNGTQATMTGQAIWLEAPMQTNDNEPIEGAAVFQWVTKPTYTDEGV